MTKVEHQMSNVSCQLSVVSCNRSKGGGRGFTFVELLAAMVFIAIVIPVAVQGLTTANRAGVVAQRKRTAAWLADLKLTEAVSTEQWRTGEQSGDFSPEYPDYQWTLTDEDWLDDTVRQLTVTVVYKIQETPHEVRLTTLAPDEETTS